MKQALLAASKNPAAVKSRIHVYPDAGHAFAADYRPSYRKADAEDGFNRLNAWLKQNGAG
jgi:carboxymethylenebutenolidase